MARCPVLETSDGKKLHTNQVLRSMFAGNINWFALIFFFFKFRLLYLTPSGPRSYDSCRQRLRTPAVRRSLYNTKYEVLRKYYVVSVGRKQEAA